jgi:hypothetical protein
MQEKNPLTPPLRELEAALAALRPAASGIDRNRLMFRAGQASMRRRGRLWQGLSAGLAICLGLSLALRQVPPHAQEVAVSPPLNAPMQVAMQLPTSPGDSDRATPPTGEYLHLRDTVLAKGLDALPTATYAGPAEPALTVRSILDEAARPSNHKPRSGESSTRSGQGDNL